MGPSPATTMPTRSAVALRSPPGSFARVGTPGSAPPRERSKEDGPRLLLCDSADRARLIADLLKRNPGMGDLLADLEADDNLRARLEMELLGVRHRL